jgi:uncharacterized protein (DUF58 family)
MITDPQGINPVSGGFVDPRALMSIRHLEMRAKVVVEGFWSGLHRSPYHGFSVEFTEYRQYTPGDDPRYLDWGLYGRSDRYYIRKFEDETNLRCQLVVDRSKSMTFGTGSLTKDKYAATLAATLAYFLHSQGDAVGLLTFDERVREFLPPRHRLSHLRQLMLALEKPAEGKATSLTDPLDHLVELTRRRGMFVYLSDFLAPIEKLEASLLALTTGRHEVAVIQILDPSELSLNFGSASLFEDIETGKTLYIEPAAARKAYLPKLTAHNTAVRRTCEKLGVSHMQLTTDQPLENVLFNFVKQRQRRGRANTVSRNPGRA